MNSPINAVDLITSSLFILAGLFIYTGYQLDIQGYILIGTIELILGIIQLIINRNPKIIK